MQFEIPGNVIVAMRQFAADKADSREYLRSIYIEAGRKELRLVAANGAILAVYKANLVSDGHDPENRIIPIDLFKHVKKNAPCTILLAHGLHVTVAAGGTSVSGLAMDREYPDYRRGFPVSTSGETAHYNPALTSKIYDAAVALNGTRDTYYFIRQNGTDAATIDFGRDDFTACIMPLRIDGSDYPGSSWVKESN
jgi:DNA polymerase III sliding clamp (beta) subunit (PCNA family)